MTESQVVNGWQREGRISTKREDLIAVLDSRFPGAVSADVRQAIQHNESLDLLHTWLLAAASAREIEEFVRVLRQ